MKIIAAEFEKSVVHVKDCPKDPLAEVAFGGRSNVGKSSMMNTLLGRKGLVKTSSTPPRLMTLPKLARTPRRRAASGSKPWWPTVTRPRRP